MTRRRVPTWHADWDIHKVIVNILRRGGDLDALARDIIAAIKGRGWKEPGPTGLGVSRCRYHKSTDLVHGRCPIPSCQWSPHLSPAQQAAMDEQAAAAARTEEERLRDRIADALDERAGTLDRAAAGYPHGSLTAIVLSTQAGTYGTAAQLIRQSTEKINDQKED